MKTDKNAVNDTCTKEYKHSRGQAPAIEALIILHYPHKESG
jgi:hypothetical protein